MAHEAPWAAASAELGRRLGLHFPHARLRELKRALRPAAIELGLADADACAVALAAGRLDASGMGVLASHLTVGETYFMRGEETFAALRGHVLPALIEAGRRDGRFTLKLWSAGCCTGEEAYSLAILADELLQGDAAWTVDVLGTDINPRFLAAAEAGHYGEWSFRGTREAWRQRHFQRTADGRFAVVDRIRRQVRFARLNLADAGEMAAIAAPATFDLVLCRNVLMYFRQDQAARVVARFHRSLREGGWLVAAPCEISQPIFTRFDAVCFPDAILHRKPDGSRAEAPAPRPRADFPPPAAIPMPAPRPPVAARPASAVASTFVRAATPPPTPEPTARPADPEHHERRARALADRGQLDEALACCDAWIAASRLDASAHALRAAILMERGGWQEAQAALRRCLFLAPDDAMARFALARVEDKLGHHEAARQQYRNVLAQAASAAPDTVLATGISAAQLVRMAQGMLEGDDRG